jgi:DNA-binding response OmpR family regulator
MKVLIADEDWAFARKAWAHFEASANLVLWEPQASRIAQRAASWQPDLLIVSARQVEQGVLDDLPAHPLRPAVLVTEHMADCDRAWRAWQKGGDELLLKPVFQSRDLHEAAINALRNAACRQGHRRQLTASVA